MLHRFGGCELDTAARELRIEGREIALQPRVFDVLAYLVEHSDRVIGKDELLDALWPGVVVTESSLQRTVSLARAALKEAGVEDAIRTHARCGYRFCSDAAAATTASNDTAGEADELYRQARWADALAAYAAADSRQPLAGEALERWATCAQCIGDLARAVSPLERAAAAHSARGDRRAAARATLTLARVRMESMELAIARGCVHRARSLLEGLPTCDQHGHLAWTTARLALLEGDLAVAREQAAAARELGRELHDPDIESMGLLFEGVAVQADGETRRGLAMQDEAAAAALSGEVSPLIGGILYCGIVAGCCNVGDWRRAEQWTESFTQWCRRSRIDTFWGTCLLHRAELYAVRGELERAQEELQRSRRQLDTAAPWAVGEARRLAGDLHLLVGELDQAESAYREAHAHGWDPHPGYALLLHHRGQTADAIRGLLRAAELTNWGPAERRACYLGYAAVFAAMAGDAERADRVLARLEQSPESWGEGAVRGLVQRARGERRLAAGDSDAGLALVYDAVGKFQAVRAELEAASTRLRLAEVHLGLQDHQCADLELSSAESLFRRAGATWYLQQCERLRGRMTGFIQ